MDKRVLSAVLCIIIILISGCSLLSKKQPVNESSVKPEAVKNDSVKSEETKNDTVTPEATVDDIFPPESAANSTVADDTPVPDVSEPPAEETPPAQQPVVNTGSSSLTSADCGTEVAIGTHPPFCFVMEDGSINLSVINSGFENLSGIYVELGDKRKELLQKMDVLMKFYKGSEYQLIIPAPVSPNLSRIEISPVQGSTYCQDRAIVIFISNSCK